MQGRNTLVIAQHLAIIQKTDRISVLDKSKMVESGTHVLPIAQEGLSAKLAALQFGA
jgi:ATP-binding cassette, subfamily B, bacterial